MTITTASHVRDLPSAGRESLPLQRRPDALSDLDLIARIAAGDRDAMTALYRRHQVMVYRFALRIVGNRDGAEDVASDVFLTVWRKAASYSGRSKLTTWLLAITRNRAIEMLRGGRTEPLDETDYAAIEDPSDTPELALHRKHDLRSLAGCLSELSRAHREVVDLVYYHARTVEEAASIIGVPCSTVKTRMFYARRRLAVLLARQAVGAS